METSKTCQGVSSAVDNNVQRDMSTCLELDSILHYGVNTIPLEAEVILSDDV